MKWILLSFSLLSASVAQAVTPQLNVDVNPLQPPISAGPLVSLNGHTAVAGQRVAIPGVNVTNYVICDLVLAQNNVATGLNPVKQTRAVKNIQRIKRMGFGFIRIHGMDCFHGLNAFCATNAFPTGVTPTTTHLDDWAMKALCWFIDVCRQNDLRVCLTGHYNRSIYATDVAVFTNNAANPPPEFAECLSYVYDYKTGAGGLWPWKVYSPAMQQIDAVYEQQLLGYKSPYDAQGRTIGQLIDLFVIENEHLIGKQLPIGGWMGIPQVPVLQQLHAAALAAWCASQGLNPATLTNYDKSRFCAYLDVQLAQKAIARIRPLTNALLISNTYFGDGQWPSVPGCQCGDATDCHFYAGNPDGFTNGRAPGDARPRVGAVAAGVAVPGKVQACTEYGPQYNNAVVAPADLAQDLAAAYDAFIAQDLDLIFMYAYSNSPFGDDGSTLPVGCFDLRVQPLYLKGVQAQNARFADLSLRPTTSVTFTPAMWGVMPTPKQYIYPLGPFTDPLLYAIPAGLKAYAVPAVSAPRYHGRLRQRALAP